MSGRLFVTGDTHGTGINRLSGRNWPMGRQLDKDDYVVVCGDFGLVWNAAGEDPTEKWWLDWLDQAPFTTLFVDGNHENFDRLGALPKERWHGGSVHFIRPSVIHLMRGGVFELCGLKAFVMGGAVSVDKASREPGVSWWPQEVPDDGELAAGIRALDEHGRKVDLVLSHEAPLNIKRAALAGCGSGYGDRTSDPVSNYLQWVDETCDWKLWFFGHHHEDRSFGEEARYRMLFHDIVEVTRNGRGDLDYRVVNDRGIS